MRRSIQEVRCLIVSWSFVEVFAIAFAFGLELFLFPLIVGIEIREGSTRHFVQSPPSSAYLSVLFLPVALPPVSLLVWLKSDYRDDSVSFQLLCLLWRGRSFWLGCKLNNAREHRNLSHVCRRYWHWQSCLAQLREGDPIWRCHNNSHFSVLAKYKLVCNGSCTFRPIDTVSERRQHCSYRFRLSSRWVTVANHLWLAWPQR